MMFYHYYYDHANGAAHDSSYIRGRPQVKKHSVMRDQMEEFHTFDSYCEQK